MTVEKKVGRSSLVLPATSQHPTLIKKWYKVKGGALH